MIKEVNMSEIESFGNHGAMLLGICRGLQALTAALCRTDEERAILEDQLQHYLEGTATGLVGQELSMYQIPLEGMLKVVKEIKDQG